MAAVKTSSNRKLVDEIQDEFLICGICSEPYRRPKTLICLHTFCARCIENTHDTELTYRKYGDPREVTCPICRKRTQLPLGGVKNLMDNTLIISLWDLVDRQKKSASEVRGQHPPCHICGLDDDDGGSLQNMKNKNKVIDNDDDVGKKGITLTNGTTESRVQNKQTNKCKSKNDKKTKKTTNTKGDKPDEFYRPRKSFIAENVTLRTNYYEERAQREKISSDSSGEESDDGSSGGSDDGDKTGDDGVSSGFVSESNRNKTSSSSSSNNNNNNNNNSHHSSSTSNYSTSNNTTTTNSNNSSNNNKDNRPGEKSNEDKTAVSKCLECNKLLCKTCVRKHKSMKVTSRHSLFDLDTEKDAECKDHPGEPVRFYCEPCQTCVCVLCAFNSHRDHNVEHFTDAASKHREPLRNLVDRCRQRSASFGDTLTNLTDLEVNLKQVETKIRETASEMVMQIRREERSLVEELQQRHHPNVLEYVENKKDLSLQIETIKSTCSLADVIVDSNDVEMMLLKRDVEEKLEGLLSVGLKHLPDDVFQRKLTFIPGSAHLGDLKMESKILDS